MARCSDCPLLDSEEVCDKPCGADLEHPKLRETGNGPQVSYEEALLRQEFGEPCPKGVYGCPLPCAEEGC